MFAAADLATADIAATRSRSVRCGATPPSTRSTSVATVLSPQEGGSPTFEMLKRASAASDWPLETWAADLLLTCRVGQQFDDTRDDRVRYFLERRSGPIGAALAVSITLPDS